MSNFNELKTSQPNKSFLKSNIGEENAERLTSLFNFNKEFYLQDNFDFEWLNGIADQFYKQLQPARTTAQLTINIDIL